jgi:hypothetical protein
VVPNDCRVVIAIILVEWVNSAVVVVVSYLEYRYEWRVMELWSVRHSVLVSVQ